MIDAKSQAKLKNRRNKDFLFFLATKNNNNKSNFQKIQNLRLGIFEPIFVDTVTIFRHLCATYFPKNHQRIGKMYNKIIIS